MPESVYCSINVVSIGQEEPMLPTAAYTLRFKIEKF